MKCNCLSEIEAEVKKKVSQIQKDKGRTIHEFVDESESGFTCKGLSFASGKWEVILPIEYKYRLLKKDGTPETRVTKKKTNFVPSYCPFCGKKA